MIVFGPVVSRRLGKSLGINHIPPKYCTYSCVYCQVGKTNHLIHERQEFYAPEEVYKIVEDKLDQLRKIGETVDFITLVPDGEPTLDKNLRELINRLKTIGLPVAVITNGSLLGNVEVRESLGVADWVCVKIDTVVKNTWRKINRPIEFLDLTDILHGIEEFAKSFQGTLVTETMLIKNLGDSSRAIQKTARFIHNLRPGHSYLLIPTRPPAEFWVEPPDAQDITRAYLLFKQYIPNVTLLIDFPIDNFPVTSHLEEEILSLTSVHPLRKQDMEHMIRKDKSEFSTIEKLIREDKLIQTEYQGDTFYIRKFSPQIRSG